MSITDLKNKVQANAKKATAPKTKKVSEATTKTATPRKRAARKPKSDTPTVGERVIQGAKEATKIARRGGLSEPVACRKLHSRLSYGTSTITHVLTSSEDFVLRRTAD